MEERPVAPSGSSAGSSTGSGFSPSTGCKSSLKIISQEGATEFEGVYREAPATQLAVSHEMGDTEEIVETPFQADVVASFSCHGIEPGKHGTGQSKVNQDCACVCHPFCRYPRCALFCVFDGHGSNGTAVSSAAMEFVVEELERRLLQDDGIVESLERTFEMTNEFLRLNVDATVSGACAVALFMHENRLWCANAGDCRAVLGVTDSGCDRLRALRLSTDHKPTDPEERERIESFGAEIFNGCDDPHEPARIYRTLKKRSLGPGLAMSRSLGDLNDADTGLIPSPTVRYHEMFSADNGFTEHFIIAASDGVWEHLSDQEAVDIVAKAHREGKPAKTACTTLIAHAALRWRNEEGNYRDDITAVVAYLPCWGN